MSDIFDLVVALTDHSDFVGDAQLQAMLKRLIQGRYGHYSPSIKTGAYAATATALWLQITDTDDVPVDGTGFSVQRFNVLYLDSSNPVDVKYLWWQQLRGEDPGDGSLALHLQNNVDLMAQSHTLGTGVGEFSLATANVNYFRVFLNQARPATTASGEVSQLLFVPYAVQSITASTLIQVPARSIQISGSGGPVTVTAAPSIVAGTYQGQDLYIIGGTNAVTIQSESVLAGSRLALEAYQRTLERGDILKLLWMTDGVVAWWVEDNFKQFASY